MRKPLIAVAALGLLATACAPSTEHVSMELTPEAVLAVDPHMERNATDPVRNEIGRQFLVEHFEASTNGLMLQSIASQRPAGFVFWNSNKVGGAQLREVIRTYAAKAASTGTRKGLLFSTDYEGGGLLYTPSGHTVSGIQRFKNDMTGLAHPAWLEKSIPRFGTELCKLHGQIMAQELTSIGINYPLTMVADLSNALFALRSVSKDPEIASVCLQAALDAFLDNGHVIFVTKHFPGLGQTRGDTHEGTVISRASTMEEEMRHLKPFIELINRSKAKGRPELLSILASHAEIPVFDPGRLTTESPTILRNVLRRQLGFGALAVSDAMWMGDYGPLTLKQMLPIYLNSFISGLDILMIKGAHFAGAVSFFRQVYDNEVSPELRAAIEDRTGLSFADARATFIARLKESSRRLDQVIAKVGDPRSFMGRGAPRDETTRLRAHYDRILISVDTRWQTVLEGLRAQEGSSLILAKVP